MKISLLENLEEYLPKSDSVIARDLRLNLKRVLTESQLLQEERFLTLLALAQSLKWDSLRNSAEAQLREAGLSDEQLLEAKDSAAQMAMLNTYYRFRHMLGKDEEYKVAGLRMTVFSKPHLGKERFEMLAFALSVLNGCETCIQSHEKVLRDAGLTADKVHDLARMASVMKGLSQLE